MKLITRRDHTRVELLRKLSAKGYDSATIEQALKEAQEKGWINENRFIDAYIQMRKRRGYGALRIRAELRERGVAEDVLRVAFAEIDGGEYLAQVFQKKFGCAQLSNDFILRAKQIRFLQYRGFSLEEINRALLSISEQ